MLYEHVKSRPSSPCAGAGLGDIALWDRPSIMRCATMTDARAAEEHLGRRRLRALTELGPVGLRHRPGAGDHRLWQRRSFAQQRPAGRQVIGRHVEIEAAAVVRKKAGLLTPLTNKYTLTLLFISMTGALAGLLIDFQFYTAAASANMGSKGNTSFFCQFLHPAKFHVLTAPTLCNTEDTG